MNEEATEREAESGKKVGRAERNHETVFTHKSKFKRVGVLLVRAVSARQASQPITHTATSNLSEKMGWFFALI